MSPEYHLLLFQCNLVNLESCLCVMLCMVLFAVWLAPGGLAWARTRSKALKSIPGPSGYPLIGLLTVFSGSTPHRVLAKLATTFKAVPLMAFSVGLTRFVISSEPGTAKEILGNSAFADRPVNESAYELLFHRAMGFAPYGEHWRNLRRISAIHFFSPKRISGFEGFRREVGLEMVNQVNAMVVKSGQVKVRKLLHLGSLNNLMMTVFGKRYDFDDADSEDKLMLEELVSQGYELLGIFNWSDHCPLLGWLDLQGVRKRCRVLVSKVNVFVGKFIEEHRLRRANGLWGDNKGGVGDFVDVLLDLEKDDKLTDSDMIAFLWEMIIRGTDTVAILLEWVLARMVLHPEIQSRAQTEIDAIVEKSRPVMDSDIQKLPYLQAIVKETLRLHPPGPLLSWARMAIHDVHVGDNFIPAGTTAMVNMWAITHDEKVWAEPEQFKPERFLLDGGKNDVSIMGSDLRLAPFGSGRRVCPGKAMGLATVHLWLAQLLRSFKWVPCDESHDVDLTECLKLSMEMKNPLVCRAIPRSI